MTATAHYSSLDRMLHNAAFAGMGLQKAVADVEDTIFKAELAQVAPGPPIFVASLPRAGTTLVLELLNKLPSVATHTYRHMPFLLCPMLWERISKGFRREATLSERAHGDGIEIGFDSPEAFEEAIWRSWWPKKYEGSQIALWTRADADEEFEAFLESHFRKIIRVRRSVEPGACRYVSKNNGNIARLPYLMKLFPEARVIVPVRHPLSHVGSLLHQHLKFSKTHAEDAFAKRYMSSIGHFDFGANLRPIAFPGAPASSEGADKPDFWLEYWIAAFETLQQQKTANVMFASYERLCTAPEAALECMLAHAGELKPGLAATLAAQVREGASRLPKDLSLEPTRVAHAEALYQSLVAAD